MFNFLMNRTFFKPDSKSHVLIQISINSSKCKYRYVSKKNINMYNIFNKKICEVWKMNTSLVVLKRKGKKKSDTFSITFIIINFETIRGRLQKPQTFLIEQRIIALPR